MKLHNILTISNIKYKTELDNIDVDGITSRSFDVNKNYIFVCLKGTKSSGYNYIDEALKKGACAVVIDDPSYICDKSILVDDARSALSKMLNAFNGEPVKKLKFIGITGTNGKTSVSVMIKNFIESFHFPVELIGTLNCSSFSENAIGSKANFTTPDPEELYPMLLRMSEAGVRFVVMEASSHALKLKKLEPIEFEIGIFTNLTEDHLDFHLDMEDYFKSKLELFKKCRLGIINIDDEYGKRIADIAPCEIKTCSVMERSDYFVEDLILLGEKGSRFTLASDCKRLDLECKIPGEFSVMNAMQSCACAIELGIDDNTIEQSLKGLKNIKGRLEKIELFENWDFTVYIDYAHTPDALLKLLDTVNSFKDPKQRVVLLFGCGGDREKQKRKVMGDIAVNNSDVVIITSDNPRSEDPNVIIEDILSGVGMCQSYIVIPDRKRAIAYAIENALPGDIILLAGKGHENYEINSQGVFPFDERNILSEIKTTRRNEL